MTVNPADIPGLVEAKLQKGKATAAQLAERIGCEEADVWPALIMLRKAGIVDGPLLEAAGPRSPVESFWRIKKAPEKK